MKEKKVMWCDREYRCHMKLVKFPKFHIGDNNLLQNWHFKQILSEKSKFP
jgi:hypothetical protein